MRPPPSEAIVLVAANSNTRPPSVSEIVLVATDAAKDAATS